MLLWWVFSSGLRLLDVLKVVNFLLETMNLQAELLQLHG